MSDAPLDQIEMLEAENADLRERLLRFERDFMGGGLRFPSVWMLTGYEQRLLGVLLTREAATKDQIMTALYREFGRDEPHPKIVDVFVHKLRKKMAPHGLRIETLWGEGYRVAEPQRSDFRRMVETKEPVIGEGRAAS